MSPLHMTKPLIIQFAIPIGLLLLTSCLPTATTPNCTTCTGSSTLDAANLSTPTLLPITVTASAASPQPPTAISQLESPYPTRDLTATTVAMNLPTWSIYDSDPEHIWNRVFKIFYGRTTPNGSEYGFESLDPLLWPQTDYLLRGEAYQAAITLLDEFITNHSEGLINDPLKRAIFQRDMWAVFDWLCLSDSYPDQRQALKERLAEIIFVVALTTEEIEALPDNYRLAIESRAYPEAFEDAHSQVEFLPSDLLFPNGEWISLGRQDGPIAWTHTTEFPFFGRSVFLVHLRMAGGREVGSAFINELNAANSEQNASNLEVALVRRMMLIDQERNIVLSPIVESVQIRHFTSNYAQQFYEFSLDRKFLFAGITGGLRPVKNDFLLFRALRDPFVSFEGTPEVEITQEEIPELCQSCHSDQGLGIDGINSILSHSRQRFPLPNQASVVLIETTFEDEAQQVIEWKLSHQTWLFLNSFKTENP